MVKQQFLAQAQSAATALANAVATCNAVAEMWTDHNYQSGANPLTDADLVALGIQFTVVQMTAFIALIPTIQTFWQSNHAKANVIRTNI